MPAIVVERYQTGRYATNAASEATYQRAMERVGQGNAAIVSKTAGQLQGSTSNVGLSEDQVQAIGQAMAAHSRGGNVSISEGKAASASGGKSSPLYVVVDESWGSVIFKWVKFFFLYAIVAYALIVGFMLSSEFMGAVRRVGGMSFTEAQPQQQKARFSDVHGCDEAKEELQELVEFLKNPKKFSTLGGKLPKGVLLVGPPGTGKTLLARAVAGEAGVPFFFMSGSEFDEVYVGVGAKRIRELFTAARAKAPAIIFIDELDAVGGKRNERDSAYAKQTLNQLLTELDGFSQDTGVIIIAATNFPKLLDKALTRPGRFDRHVVVPLPDVRGRMQILQHHMAKVKVETAVDPSTIARQTPGFSGAELENLVNTAAIRASRNQQKAVTNIDFDWARDRILMGAERRSAVIQHKDRVMTAYHEGGHALVALFTKGANPVYKATIMPRGQSLGMTSFLPEMDQVSMSKLECLAQIDISLGGKIAEEIIYGNDNVTTGAASVRTSYTLLVSPKMKVDSAAYSSIGSSASYQRRLLHGHADGLYRRARRHRPRQPLLPPLLCDKGAHRAGGAAHCRRVPRSRCPFALGASPGARAARDRPSRVRGARPRGDAQGAPWREAGQAGRQRHGQWG